VGIGLGRAVFGAAGNASLGGHEGETIGFGATTSAQKVTAPLRSPGSRGADHVSLQRRRHYVEGGGHIGLDTGAGPAEVALTKARQRTRVPAGVRSACGRAQHAGLGIPGVRTGHVEKPGEAVIAACQPAGRNALANGASIR
jgi:hypothetical protein